MIFRAWAVPGDTLVVYDPVVGRISYLDSAGDLISTHQYQPVRGIVGEASPNIVLGRFADGSFMARPNSDRPWDESGDGIVRPPFALVRVASDASDGDTIAVLAGSAYYFLGTMEGMPDWRSQPHGAQTFAVANGETVLVSDTDALAARELDLDGREIRRYSRRLARTPVLDTDWDAIRDQRIKSFRETQERSGREEGDFVDRNIREIRRAFAEIQRPEFFPTHDELRVDLSGNVWLRHFAQLPAPTRTWSVFSETGPFLGEVTVPSAFRITEIGADWILGVWRDELDVESVREFRLIKP